MKKSVFTYLNYVLPPQHVMPMHCSANTGKDGDTAYETDLLEFGDIFDGSKEVAALVGKLKREALDEIAEIDAMGDCRSGGLGSTIMHYWPQISVEPTAAAEPSNPFSGYFKITNDQGYPLTNVGIEASLRCAKIGRGDDTSPPKECLPSMHNSKTVWTNHTLEPHEPYEITPGDLMFVTPGGLLYAQISIFVSYRPWRIPWTMTNELRFQSRRLSDGKIEWLHIPAD